MIAPDASIGKCNDCRSSVSRDCDIVTRDPHELVNEIIILLNPIRHAPRRNAKQEIVALRPIFPLSPDLPPPSTSESKVDRPRSVSHAGVGQRQLTNAEARWSVDHTDAVERLKQPALAV